MTHFMDGNKVQVQFAFKEFINFFLAHNSISMAIALMNSLYTYFASVFDIEVKKILGVVYYF
jgi:hypothetical protein